MIDSKIQWTDHTWNPWHGCIKVSEGCKFCYMYRDKERYGQDPTTVLKSKTKFNEPYQWKDTAKVFTCSWSDFFIKEADLWRPEAWKIIKNTPHLTYQILTKRPERIIDCLPLDWGDGYDNVWLGVSVENQNNIDRIVALGEIKTIISKFKTFASIEPLIGPIAFDDSIVLSYEFENLDWVIVGGESGNETGKYQYRPCDLEWIKSIINQCKDSKVPVFMKQMGTSLANLYGYKDRHGGNINEWPKFYRIREFPVETIHEIN